MSVRVITGDCRDVLAGLPAESVHCCVTSPPYWGLRDYGIPPTVWGGDPACKHSWGENVASRDHGIRNGRDSSTLRGGVLYGDETYADIPKHAKSQSQFCRHCNAWRGAHGLEPAIHLYVRNAVEVFRAVHRVLRPDGVLWLNLGDSYATGAGKVGNSPGGGEQGERWNKHHMPQTPDLKNPNASIPTYQPNRMPQAGLKPKDLCGIPWRVAFALQAGGWWLRQDIIWAKPNPMPESVTDRCTKAHEYLFLLSKSARYCFDAEAIKERDVGGHSSGNGFAGRQGTADYRPQIGSIGADGTRRTGGEGTRDKWFPGTGRNKRSVWTVATSPFSAGQVWRDGGDDSGRIVTPDCPVYGGQRRQETKVQRGEQRDASQSARNPRTDSHRVQAQQGVLFPTETIPDEDSARDNLDLRVLAYKPSAIPNNIEIRKTDLALETSPRENDAEIAQDRTDGTEPRSGLDAIFDRIPESNNGPDVSVDAPQIDPLERTALSNDRKCTCRLVDHFAVFPQALIEPCIKAGTSEKGCCAKCGAPWERWIEKIHRGGDRVHHTMETGRAINTLGGQKEWDNYVPAKTLGWRPTCKCDAAVVPCTVLYPFGGAGTTGLVADRLQRNAILIELNPDYAAMAQRRLERDAPLLSNVAREAAE